MPNDKHAAFGRWLAVLILFAIAFAHSLFPSRITLDWPTVVLVCSSLLLALGPKVGHLLPLIKRLKLGQAEIELLQKAEEVAVSVEKSEAQVAALPPSASDDLLSQQKSENKRLSDATREEQIISLASHDRLAAILMLAIEIEREVLFLTGMLGLRSRARTGSLRESIRLLQQQQVISIEVAKALLEFSELRNQIVHSTVRFRPDDPTLISALDSGLRLLRLLKTIPRPIYRVKKANVPLFKDPEQKQRIEDAVGVILETLTQDGMVEERIFPAGREFMEGEVVGWDWDMTRTYGKAYYWDETLQRVRSGWDSSAAFAGRHEELPQT